MSVTTEAGKIVYLESDWGGLAQETECDLVGLKFGETTLSELRKRFGSNGFGFKGRDPVMDIPGGIVMMNSFDVGNTVVTFVTKIYGKEYARARDSGQIVNPGDFARLDAITLAKSNNARSEWGERIYGQNYKKIEWK